MSFEDVLNGINATLDNKAAELKREQNEKIAAARAEEQKRLQVIQAAKPVKSFWWIIVGEFSLYLAFALSLFAFIEHIGYRKKLVDQEFYVGVSKVVAEKETIAAKSSRDSLIKASFFLFAIGVFYRVKK